MAMEALVATTFISIAKMELFPDLLLMINSLSTRTPSLPLDKINIINKFVC